jgi:hypothetical protein
MREGASTIHLRMSWRAALLILAVVLNGCSPQDRPVVLEPLDWDEVDRIAEAALDTRFPQVDKSHITARGFRLYTYELDHNGNPKEEFIQSFEYDDPDKHGFLSSRPSIECWIDVGGQVNMPGGRTFPFKPEGSDRFTPIRLDQTLRVPDFTLIDDLAKSAVSSKVDPQDLVFRSLSVSYRANTSSEKYTIQFYDASSVRIESIEGRNTLFYTWVRIQLNKYGEVTDIMWHTPEMNIEGREAQLANLPHPPASVPWPPER